MNVEIKEISATNFLFLPHTGVDNLESTFNKLIAWGTPLQLLEDENSKIGRIFHDSFTNTAPNKVRMSIGFKTSASIEQDSLISKTTIPKHKAIAGSFTISLEEFQNAWSQLYQWMHKNGHKPSYVAPYEIYNNDYRQHSEQKCDVTLYIPIF
ncbi:DNA gyrase inhibitor GyrI [Wenyingzhuangia heitensis]|uniref:DNA gyrase inhibitor GyrI n=1 Tax=Wenyingzhuangia heitensis TaxID=1487859 RepID=A0ABX0U6M9_9FLAO|nr:GyrI-like domain-containing protein [Wenyingzhuangia heitensis]NIJ44503.1 DNA gyrase inhibitor GyrI [Wenyingzhuangia heitensis]